jgi:hypothetical protein
MRKRELFRTGDQALVRQINLALVMDVLRRLAPISRATLSQAISSFVNSASSPQASGVQAHF